MKGTGPASAEHLTPVPALSGFRSMLRYWKRPLARFEAARLASDRAVAFDLLGLHYMALFDLDAIEQVLVTRHAAFEKDSFTHDLRHVLGTGLLTSEGELWRRHRKLLAPSFQRGEIAGYGSTFAERARAFVESQPEGVVFDVHSQMMHLTLDILVRALFGTKVSRADRVERLLDQLMWEYLPAREALRVALPEWVPLPSRKRLPKLRADLDAILFELIEGRRRRGEAEEPGAQNDLLGRLMQAQDASGSLSEAALRDEAMTLFLAGHETTALSLTYVLRLLALHPEEERRVREEIERVLGARAPALVDLPSLPYTRAVIDEALRLYPPAWAVGRQPLEDTLIAGIWVPKGTQVVICGWVLHRDERFFEQPGHFWPERWLGKPAPPRFAYLPFGAGPRVCIGNHFALAEAMIILITLLQNARFELASRAPLELVPTVTLRPKGPVPMRMQRL